MNMYEKVLRMRFFYFQKYDLPTSTYSNTNSTHSFDPAEMEKDFDKKNIVE